MDPVTGMLIATGVNTGGNIAGGMIGAKQQHKRNKELQAIQYTNQRLLNEQGHELQKQMWEHTNYPNQVRMLQEAGLNPALMYGKGGAGGSTGSQGGGSAASGSAGMPNYGMGMDITNALAQASQIELNNAQAKKLNAEANKIAGVDTDLVKTTIDKAKAETKNIESQQKLNELNAIVVKIEGETRYDVVMAEIGKELALTRQIDLDNEITDKTKGEVIRDVYLKNVETVARTDKFQSATKLDESQMWKISEELYQIERKITLDYEIRSKELDVKEREVYVHEKEYYIKKFNAELEAWFKEENINIETQKMWLQFSGKIIGDIIGVFTKPKMGKGSVTKSTRSGNTTTTTTKPIE